MGDLNIGLIPYIASSTGGGACACDVNAVYVFLGDEHALIDLVRYMHARGLNNGDYVVIGVHDHPYDPHKQRYFNKCQSVCLPIPHCAITGTGLIQPHSDL